ncbi:hypothetical protein V8C34DRAFT_274365 [Trichoderma compactum]
MDGPNAWPDIYSAALDCDLLFDKCLIQIAERGTIGLLNESAAAFGRLARDHQARFQAWASYLGVFAEEDVCLDRRLSKSKDVQIMVINLLRIIFLNLRYLLQTIQIRDDDTHSIAPMRETELHIQQSAPSIDNLTDDLRQTQESVEGAIDRLHRLGVIIRQCSTASLISRVRAFSAKRSDSSLEEMSFLMIKFLYPMAPLDLQRLLSRSILERHFNIEYRGEHQRRLEARRKPVSDDDGDHKEDQPRVHNGSQEVLRPVTRKDYVNEAADIVRDDSEKETEIMPSKSGTKPSTLQTQEFQHKVNEKKPLEALSAVSKTSSVPVGDVNYPKPPKPQGENDFATCYWCFESYPYDKFQNVKWWRRHVDRDLRPYVCLVNTCSESLEAFDRFTPWMEHMEKHHSANWVGTIGCRAMWQCDIEHESSQLFEDEASLKGHIQEHHHAIFTESQIAGIARRSSIRIPGSKDVCPLCSFNFSNTPLDADEPNHSRHSLQIKRKRPTRTKVNLGVQEKRRKVHFHDEGGRRDLGLTSSSESELDLPNDPSTESILPQMKERLQRKQLSRHIATHLKALSFVSLRLRTFQEQLEIGDEDFATEGKQGDTSEDGGPSGLDTELDALSLNFEDTPTTLNPAAPAMFMFSHGGLNRLEDGSVSPTFDPSEFLYDTFNQPADTLASPTSDGSGFALRAFYQPADTIHSLTEFPFGISRQSADTLASLAFVGSQFLHDILNPTEQDFTFTNYKSIDADFFASITPIREYNEGGFVSESASELILRPWDNFVTREDIEQSRSFFVLKSADANSNAAALRRAAK